METKLLIVFGIISFVIGLSFFIWSVYLYKKRKTFKRVLSPIHVYTVGVFLSVLLVFIPLYYIAYDFGDSHSYIRPLLIAVHNSLRIFILDGDFDIIVDSLEGQSIVLHVLYSLYAAFLFVIAPVLTFSNVLSLFKNLKSELRFKWHRYKNHYIMSELNQKSIALARSIFKREKDAVIVFTDVFEQNEEDDYELLTQARELNAILLKKDVSHLNFVNKKGDVEIFLIGNDESENVSQAVKVTTELNRKNSKHNVKVFVFSSKPSASYIIDSVKYDNLLNHASEHDFGDECFKLRRIDEKQQLIWNTIPEMHLFETADKNDKTISVLIAGFGSYGFEFFKTIVWLCQFEGYRLEINIFDKQNKTYNGDKNIIKSVIDKSCPELMKHNRTALQGESVYDIEIFSGVDFETADFKEMVFCDEKDEEKKKIANRLKKTNVVFVALGDDDLNIDVAVYFRSLFDRIKGVVADEKIGWDNEPVSIYSVVYDEQKSGILQQEECNDEAAFILHNHKKIPYHIHFIGGMSSQFDYLNIYNDELEKTAFAHHCCWVNTKEDAVKAKEQYEKYEYYRLSSMAKELYIREIKSNPRLYERTKCLEAECLQTCKCENCIRRKKSEHMRWNAYTRVIGYSYGKRADRAKLHNNLCEWYRLSELDKQKD